MARNHPPLKLRRGTEAEILAASVSDFEVGEPIFATDSGKLFIKNAAGTLEEISGSGDGSGPGGTVSWGSITGLLSNQTDLNTALSGKAATGHTHTDATTSAAGFMSASDKTKLNGIAAGAQVNTVTSVAGKTGAVSLTSSDVGLGSVPNTDTTNAANITSGTLPAGRINDTSHGNRGGGSLHAVASTSTAGFMSAADKSKLDGIASGATANTGTVTSVDLSVPSSLLGVSGNPVTGSGTLAISLPNRDANAVFAGPTTGSAAAPSFRSLVAADIPDLAATKITSGQIPSAVTFDTANSTGFSNAVEARLLVELPTDGGVLDIAQESTLIGLSNDIDAIEARSITAGTGLTGGGTLAASRTIAVDFATTKTGGRVVEANDPRLDDTRTPTDNTVSTAKIQNDAVTADKIADNAVGSAQIADAAVTMAKIAQAGATTNQVIKWNGSAWAPADDATATGAAGAPSDAEYLVKSSDGGLSAERVVTDSTSITADWATGGQVQLKRAALTGDVTADANSNTTTIVENAILLKHIADGAVSYSKIQDVSATDKILGRSSAGAGDIEEITCTAAGRALLDDADAAAQRTTLGAAAASHDHGSITNDGKIGSSSGLVVKTGADGAVTTLGMGTAGQVLKVNSSATDIEWGTDNTSGGSVTVGTDDIWTAKGELAVGTGDNTAQALSAGTNGQYLVAASGETTGLKWQSLAVGSSSGLPIKTGTDGVLEAGAFGTSAGQFAEGNHTHAWSEITSKPSDFTPSAHTHGLTDSYIGEIAAAANQTYTIDRYVAVGRTITDIRIQSTSGTCTAAVKNGANTVGTVSVSSTSGGTSPSLSNATVSQNGAITLEISSNSSAVNVSFAIRYTAATGAIS